MKQWKSMLPGSLPVALLMLSASAGATHKSWLLQDTGATCQAATAPPNSFVYDNGAIRNDATASWSVLCPVTLAGRFGASTSPNGSFSMAQWARAREGTVQVNDTSSSSNVSCYLQVAADTGSVYYSRSVSSSATGAQTLQVYDKTNGTWGGGIGNGSTIIVRAMGYRCSLPPQSLVYGYSVNICQVGACTL